MYKNKTDVTIDNQQASILSDKVDEASTNSKETSLVECKVCHKQMQDLTSHLNKVHHITCKVYLDMYPDSLIMTESLKQRKHRLYTKAVLSAKNFETCSLGGKKSWDKKVQTGISTQSIKNMRSHINFQSPERCKKISESYKRRLQRDPQFRKQHQERMKKAQQCWQEILNSMSLEDLDLFLKKSFLGGYSLKTFEYKGHKYRMRSSYERRFAIALIDAGIEFQYEPFTLATGKFHYLPDFVIGKEIFEIRALYWLNGGVKQDGSGWFQNIKRQECAENHGYNYHLITEAILNNPTNLQKTIGDLHKCTAES